MARTLYEIMELLPAAEPAEIEAAYVRLRHSAEDVSLLRVAYDTLRDPIQRAAYDRKLQQRVADQAALSGIEVVEARTGGRWILLGVSVAIAIFAWWHVGQQGKQPPISDLPASGAVMRKPSPQLPVADVQPLPQKAPEVPISPQAREEFEQVAAGSGIQLQPVQAVRPERKPGMDVDYLAWSSFQIASKRSVGSGVMIAPEKILTNCHVLAGGAMGIWVIHSMTRKPSKVEKYSRLDGEDACLLYAPGAGSDVIEWGRSDQLKPGDTVYSFGHPGGSTTLIWADGQFVRHVNRGENPYLQTAHYCRPGSSGGPLLDANGRLVGIVTRGLSVERGGQVDVVACYSLPDSSARKLLGKSMFPIGLAPAEYSGN